MTTPSQAINRDIDELKASLEFYFGQPNIQIKLIKPNIYQVHAPIGGVPEDILNGQHGGGKILNCNALFLYFQFGDLDGSGTMTISQGRIPIEYDKGSGLVLSSDLDVCLVDRVRTVSKHMFECVAAPLEDQGKKYFAVNLIARKNK